MRLVLFTGLFAQLMLSVFSMHHGRHGKIEGCDDGETGVEDDFSMLPRRKWTCQNGHWESRWEESSYKVAGRPICFEDADPSHVCMYEPVAWDTDPPTSGAHRPVFPVYGTYEFAPPVRWVHSLEHGAIVLLYHPCAPREEVELLSNVLRACLRRHIITPYPNLTRHEPLALVSYGCLLRLKWADIELAQDFIQEHAMDPKTEMQVTRHGDYDYLLLQKSQMVSNLMDDDLCPQRSQRPSNVPKWRQNRRYRRSSTKKVNKSTVELSSKEPSVTVPSEPLASTSEPILGVHFLTNSSLRTVTSSTADCANSTTGCDKHTYRGKVAWSILALAILGVAIAVGVVCMKPGCCRCWSSEVVHFEQKHGTRPIRKQLVHFAENLPTLHKSRAVGAEDYRKLMEEEIDEDDL